jgi:hypothetical protein
LFSQKRRFGKIGILMLPKKYKHAEKSEKFSGFIAQKQNPCSPVRRETGRDKKSSPA